MRLCPCAVADPPSSSIHAAVAAVVTKQLDTGQTNSFVGRQYDTKKGHSDICRGANCPASTFDLTTLGLPSNAQLVQSIR